MRYRRFLGLRKFFSDLRKLFGQLLVCALKPLFRRLHGILLLSLATAQESANERSEDKREQDEGKWILTRVTMATVSEIPTLYQNRQSPGTILDRIQSQKAGMT